MEKQMNFRISSALKNLIGKELITDEFVAVFELVKNSFDANAKNVKVIFENQYNPKDAKIIIVDDGKGMDEADLRNKWLFVGYSAKKEGTENDDYRDKIETKRIFAGAKGIGRFSCDKLGATLNLVTIKDKKNAQIENLVIDWENFEEDAKKEFIDVPVKHKVLSSMGYSIKSGTILEISDLRDEWDRKRIIKLKQSLEKLINPIQENDVQNFGIEIIAKDELLQDNKEDNARNKVNGKVENFVFELLGVKTTQIITEIIENGGIIKTTLRDRGRDIYILKEKNIYSIADVRISLFQLNRSAKLNFKKSMGVDSVKYGSVFMYKNGFRIYPFGEEGEDILQIDRRKQQGYNRFLGTRDLIGRIEINGQNPNLKETTSRDGGLEKNDSFYDLVDFFYDKALKRLENYVVDIIKWGDERVDKDTGIRNPELNPEDVKSEILEIISSLTKAKDVIDIWYDDDFLQIIDSRQEKSVSQIAKNFTRIAEETKNPVLIHQAKQAERHVKSLISAKKEVEKELDTEKNEKRQIEKELELEKKQSLFQKSIIGREKKDLLSLQHQITHTAGSIALSLDSLVQSIQKNKSKEELLGHINTISLDVKKITNASSFVTKANFNMEAVKIKEDIVQFVDDYIENVFLPHEKYIYKSKAIKVEIKNEFDVTLIKRFSPLELTIIIDNLFSNSKKAEASCVDLIWKKSNDGFITLSFIDNGKGISDNIIDRIFEFSYTTTDGSGIGLAHVKKIVEDMGGEVFVNNKIQEGVEFIIKLNK